MEELFLESSIQYAKQKNDQTFEMNQTDLWDFVTIMTVSSYNVRPQFSMYWFFDEDVSCSFIRELMPRNKFKKIKSYIHVCDNESIDQHDKWAKLRPLFNVVNKKLTQFGVFADHLSIDEQMVPYFGRHSCKMFIRGKITLAFHCYLHIHKQKKCSLVLLILFSVGDNVGYDDCNIGKE